MNLHTLEFDGILYRLDKRILTPEHSQRIRNHSPNGFSHGYGGSGPAQLALAVILELTGASYNYQDFKWMYIAPLTQGQPFLITFDLDNLDILK